ncbi:hypothetical protein COL922a_005781 [Colletotrichum nupharicola]|nr:hypothetical protein COL922a_005781 [Colletotrichum nupharicola]
MKGDPEFIVLNHAAWIQPEFEDNILGSIVKNPLSPTSDYVPAEPAKAMQYNQTSLQENIGNDFILTKSSANFYSIDMRVAKIGDAEVKGMAEDMMHLTGKTIHVKRLTQIDQFRADLRLDKTVASTVPRWFSGRHRPFPVCMVVGIMICEDAEHKVASTSESDVRIAVEVPVGTTAAVAGGMAPVVAGMIQVDPKITVEKGRKASSNFQATFRKRNIFAVELRRVTTKLFHQNELKPESFSLRWSLSWLWSLFSLEPSKKRGVLASGQVVDPEDLTCVELGPMELEDLLRLTPLMKDFVGLPTQQ